MIYHRRPAHSVRGRTGYLLEPAPTRLRRARPAHSTGTLGTARDVLTSKYAWAGFLGLMAVATLLLHVYRIGLSYDLFIDESFYVQVGQSVAHGHMPFATGAKFFLHPPGFFLVEAVWMHIVGFHSQLFAQVFSVRKLVSIFAAGTVALMAVIIDRVVGRGVAVVAAMMLMVNAFFNRDTSFVILEPATLFWALAGYAVLVYLPPEGAKGRWPRIAAAGLLFGIAVLTKEFGLFITTVPLVFALATRCVLRRREALVAIALSVLPYAIWVLVVVETGNWSDFWAQTLSGFRRTAGTEQVSGFNRAGAPSFAVTLFRDIGTLWTVYVILSLGSLAILYVAWRARNSTTRLMGLFGLGALPLSLYCILIGTNEEQFFNFLLSPALICLTIVVHAEWAHVRQVVRLLVIALATVMFAADVGNYVQIHRTVDNGTYQVDKWMAEFVPPRTTVVVTNGVQREVFLRYNMVDDSANLDLNKVPGAQYLVVFYRQVDEDYAFVGAATIARQTRGLPALFTTNDVSNGRMVVYGVP